MSLICTAISDDPPSAQALAPPPGPTRKRRGNPNLALAPRCGARTRSGCPCRAPAIRGKLRCRMHGGRSTGPRTQDGRARIAAARTIHGRYGSEWRAHDRRILSLARRGRVFRAVMDCLDRLPPDLQRVSTKGPGNWRCRLTRPAASPRRRTARCGRLRQKPLHRGGSPSPPSGAPTAGPWLRVPKRARLRRR